MKTSKAWLFLLPVTLLMCGCSEWPTGPSGDGSVRNVWSPYVGVHLYANGQTQMPYIEEMARAGALQGMRVDGPLSAYSYFSGWASGQGLDTLAIFPNELLESPDAADLFISYVRGAPQIKYWEIGNETGLFIHMSPEEYTPIFLEIYDKAKRQFPDIEIIPNAPVGGADGARYFGRMLDLGVQDLLYHPDSNYRLNIVAVHCYAIASSYQYEIKKQVERVPAGVEVWVTETGIEDSSGHIRFVQSVYPRLRDLFRASRIYWYVLSGHGEFALLQGLAEGEGVRPSPLYDQLVRP